MLGRLQSFLPAMQKANQELEQEIAQDPEACKLENVDDAAPHIEMNLACGVLDLKDSSAAAAAQQATNVGSCAAALDQAPVLRDSAASSSDPLLGAGVLDMSRGAADAEGEVMSERATRRIRKPEQAHNGEQSRDESGALITPLQGAGQAAKGRSADDVAQQVSGSATASAEPPGQSTQ